MDAIDILKKITDWQNEKSDCQHSSQELVEKADALFREIRIELYDLIDDGK